MQIKTVMRYDTLKRMAKIKNTDSMPGWEGLQRKWITHTFLVGNEKWDSHSGKQFGCSL